MSLQLKTLGFDSYAVPTVDGTPAYEIDTPFSFINDDSFYIFSEFPEGRARFFDEGMTVHSMLAAGLDFRDGKKRNALKMFLQKRGISLLPDGEIELIAAGTAPVYRTFARYLKGLLDLDSWSRDNLKEQRSRGNFLEAVRHCYSRIYPGEELLPKARIKGLGGREFRFDFAIGESRVVDALAPARQDCADFSLKATAVRNHLDLEVDGVIDDTGDQNAAIEYQSILASVGNVAVLSDLMKKSANMGTYEAKALN
jgi:acylphosphatase